ncbi:MAG TPA: acyltransferase [Rhodoblastus sp.]|nr:acyltransferase [Rhodoblastus sp.]
MSAELEAGRALPAAPGERPEPGASAPGSVAQERKSAAARIEFANTLRGVAAMSVICAHLGNTFWYWPDVVQMLTGIPNVKAEPSILSRIVPDALGGWGVSLFFVISGFVIPFSLERYSVKGFIVGRLWRIWPTCWVGLSITVAAVLIGVHTMGGAVPFTFRDAITHFFPPFAAIADSRQIDSVMWTLEIEMFFYIVCALAAARLRDGRWTLWLVPVAVFVVWLGVDQVVAQYHESHPALARRLTYFDLDPPYIVFMFCGVALNLFQRGKLRLEGTVAAIALCLALFAVSQKIGQTPIKSSAFVYALGLALFVACMLAQNWFGRWRITRFFSDISYPIYIIHGVAGYVILNAMMRHGWNSDVASLSTISLMICLAWLVHRFVEAPTHRIGQKIARNLSEGM